MRPWEVIDITNEHLSSLSDISPFTASRLLSKWERDGRVPNSAAGSLCALPSPLWLPRIKGPAASPDEGFGAHALSRQTWVNWVRSP